MFDPVQFKRHFPLFSQAGNQRLTYLDNAATTQKPQCVIDAITDFYLSKNANANRGSHRLARSATTLLEEVRAKSARFLSADYNDEIVFTSGATESLNLLATGLSHQLSEGDEILLSVAEHHANLVPWQVVAKERGVQLIFTSDDLDDIYEKVTAKTKIVACAGASNILGQINKANIFREIKDRFPTIYLVIDASQIVGKIPVNVKETACDFLVCSPHKFYGPTGIGLLYCKRDCLPNLRLSKFGGEMIKHVALYESSYAEAPYCFEAGTSSLAAIAGLGACIDFINDYFKKDMVSYEEKLIAYLHEKLCLLVKDFSAINVLTKPEGNVGIAAISSDAYSMADIGFWLDEQDIAVRVGDHCAQPLLASLNVSSVLRVSVAPYNTFEDIDRLLRCLYDFFSSNREYLDEQSENILDANNKASDYKDEFLLVNHQDLLMLRSWANRYKKILSLGKLVSSKPFLQRNENLVSGCESKLWIEVIKNTSQENTLFTFVIDSDSMVVKGLAGLILCRVNGKSAIHIKDIDFHTYFSDLGIEKYLSESRFSGMQSLLTYIFLAIK